MSALSTPEWMRCLRISGTTSLPAEVTTPFSPESRAIFNRFAARNGSGSMISTAEPVLSRLLRSSMTTEAVSASAAISISSLCCSPCFCTCSALSGR